MKRRAVTKLSAPRHANQNHYLCCPVGVTPDPPNPPRPPTPYWIPRPPDQPLNYTNATAAAGGAQPNVQTDAENGGTTVVAAVAVSSAVAVAVVAAVVARRRRQSTLGSSRPSSAPVVVNIPSL
jgi:hypothetical protein